ncbi:MAG: OadG family protein [Ruminococcus sp.]|nr:OadG family protein [Ruminococcus sp.]
MSKHLLAAAESNQSLTILVTGFVVVFAVLLLLIGIIKLYSTIVSSAENKAKKTKELKLSQAKAAPAETTQPAVPATQVADGGLDLQTVAVITAAVEAYYSDGRKVRITGIRRASGARSEWATAGISDNISMRRGF